MNYTLESIAHSLGRGKEKKIDKGYLTCCPAHDDHNPSLQILEDSKYSHGIAFHCFTGCDNKAIINALINLNLWEKYTATDKAGKTLEMVLPNSSNDYPPIKQDSILYCYKNQFNQPVFYIERTIVKGKKKFNPWCKFKDSEGTINWVQKFPTNYKRIPYNLERLGTLNKILIVEGEKTCDGAYELLRDRLPDWAILTYQGGVNSFKNTDWTYIPKNATIVLWPDNDFTGKSNFFKKDGLIDYLESLGYSGIRGVDVPANFHEKWDLGDRLPNGITVDDIEKLIENAKPKTYFRESSVNDICAVVKRLFKKEQNSLNCEQYAHPECLYCVYAGRGFQTPEITSELDTIVRENIFITEQNSFLNVTQGVSVIGTHAFNFKLAKDGFSGANLASAFLRDHPLNTAVANITWWPGKPRIIYKEGKKLWNTYKPINWPITTIQPDLWLAIIQHVIPDEAVREVFLDFLAFTLQYPAKKINYLFVISSTIQGIGKSLSMVPVQRIFGNTSRTVVSTDVGTNFTSFFHEAKFLIFEEHDAKNSSLYSRFKAYLTSPPEELSVNKKFLSEFSQANVFNGVLFSNSDNPIPIESITDRRAFTYSSPAEILPEALANAFGKQLDLQADLVNSSVYSFLIARDISNFNPANYPRNIDSINEFKESIIIENKCDEAKFLLELINSKQFPFKFGRVIVPQVLIIQALKKEFQKNNYSAGAGLKKILREIGYKGSKHQAYSGVKMPRIKEMGAIELYSAAIPNELYDQYCNYKSLQLHEICYQWQHGLLQEVKDIDSDSELDSNEAF